VSEKGHTGAAVCPQCVRRGAETAGLWRNDDRRHVAKCSEFRSCATVTDAGGNSSVVEHDLAKVGVAGSNPVSRSTSHRSSVTRGGVPKWLRERTANPRCGGSNPPAASILPALVRRPGGGAGGVSGGVRELANLGDLKSSGRKALQVRILPPLPRCHAASAGIAGGGCSVLHARSRAR
jgi:hypothetical protein